MTSAIQLPVSIPFCSFFLACVAQMLLWQREQVPFYSGVIAGHVEHGLEQPNLV